MRGVFWLMVVLQVHGCANAGSDHAPKPPPVSPAPNAAAGQPVAGEMFANKGTVVITTTGGPISYAVDLAITGQEREHGLMFTDAMADDAGMLFVFEREQVLTFWMKNTHLPLHMVFIAADGTVAGIVADAAPMTLSSRTIGTPSRYVLELNAGACAKRGIKAGQHARFEGVQPALVDARVLQ